MNVFQTVLLGVISSLTATIVWVCIIFLYNFRARKKIRYIIEQCDASTRLLLNSVEYTRYLVALFQIEKLIELYFDLNENIRPLNFGRRKRMLIKLLIYNIMRVLNIFKNLEIGYDGETELESRCEQFSKKYLYDITTQKGNTESFMIISLDILGELNGSIGIKQAMRKSLKPYIEERSDYTEILTSLIEVNSFKGARSFVHYMNKEGMNQMRYLKMIKKI